LIIFPKHFLLFSTCKSSLRVEFEKQECQINCEDNIFVDTEKQKLELNKLIAVLENGEYTYNSSNYRFGRE
jgi:hypothetical protein